jgi:hypothetical protein
VLGLVLCAVVDQATYGLGGIVGWQDDITRPAAEALLDTRESAIPSTDGRLVRGGFPNLYLLGGYRLLDGYAGLTPQKELDYRGAHALSVANVAYAHDDFLRGASIPGSESLARGWKRLPSPLPRFRLVSAARVSVTPASEIEAIDVTTSALVSRAVVLQAGATGTARVLRDLPGEIDLATDSTGPQLLVASESYDDGWRAAMDGRDVPVERVNGDFFGVVVSQGSHQVQLRFRPASSSVGRAISTVGLTVAVFLWFGGALAQRRHRHRVT